MRAEAEGWLVERLLRGGGNVIDVGELRVARSSLGPRKGPRYLIYLPTARNYLWRVLHESGRRVRVFIEVPPGVAEGSKQPAGGPS
jgi:hypothetical protein